MRYVFGEYELDTQLYELRHAGRPTKIEPKVFDVLAYLIQHRDRVVLRQELLEQLWPKQFVGEAVLSYCIMAARKAVRDNGRAQRIIKTLHGRGFRFVADVKERALDAPGSEEASVPDTSLLPKRQVLEREAPGSHTLPYADMVPLSRSAPAGERNLVTSLTGRMDAAPRLTPFVGRDCELQLLHNRFAQVKAGHGQAVFVLGEPGIGKSRLFFEFHRQLGDADSTWLEGHCLSFGQRIAFHPLIDMLKRQFQIEAQDAEDTIREKITQGVLNLGQDLHALLPYLLYLLAIDPGDPAVRSMDPQLRRGEIFDALRRLVLQASEVRPLILVFENLHWIDQATETFLTLLLDSIPTRQVLCLFSCRPGYVHTLGDRTYYTRIALTTLSTADSVRMAQTMLATTHLPEALEALLVQKAEGNPFFVEELTRSLRDIGVLQRRGHRYVLAKPLQEIPVPDTIQGVVMARIDRLEEAPKGILQTASVIGREFTRRLLGRIAGHQEWSEACLQALKASELLYEKCLYPEVIYEFKHSLTHEVVYHSLPRRRRRELHGRIARAVEALYADRPAEHYEVLAYHFMQGEEWAKALRYLRLAAEKAVDAFATREAVALYDQALEAAHKLGETVDIHTLMRLYQAKANLHLVLGDFERALAAGEHLLALARQTGDRASEGAALESMALASRYAHDLDHALAYARQAIAVAGHVGATSVISGSYLVTGSVHYLTGRLQQARADVDSALTISRSMGDITRQSFALYAAGLLRNWEGNYSEAACLQSECLSLARTHNLLPAWMRCCFGYGVTLTGKGEYDAALAIYEEGLALTEKVGDELYHCRLLNSLGWLYSELGNLDRALELNRRSAEGARKGSNHETLANAELNLGDIFLAKGDLPLAREALDSVDRLVKDPRTSDRMQWRYSTHLFASAGEFWLARGGLGKARGYADRCLEIATRTNSRKYLLRAWRLRGAIALAQGHWDDAESALRQALSIAKTIQNPTQCWRTYVAIAQLYTETRRARAARQACAAARQVLDGITANLRDLGLRTSLEHTPLVQEVYRLSASS